MSQAIRIGMLSVEEAIAAAEEVGIPPQMGQLNIFRTLLRSPGLAKATCELLLTLLFRSELEHRLRELVIMRLGWATSSVYEWTQHWPLALEQFGCSETDLLELRDWRSSEHFGPAERAVLGATDETLATGTLSEETWAACREHVGDEVVCMELVAAISTWGWISRVARSLEVPLEEGVAPWPPDGKQPG